MRRQHGSCLLHFVMVLSCVIDHVAVVDDHRARKKKIHLNTSLWWWSLQMKYLGCGCSHVSVWLSNMYACLSVAVLDACFMWLDASFFVRYCSCSEATAKTKVIAPKRMPSGNTKGGGKMQVVVNPPPPPAKSRFLFAGVFSWSCIHVVIHQARSSEVGLSLRSFRHHHLQQCRHKVWLVWWWVMMRRSTWNGTTTKRTGWISCVVHVVLHLSTLVIIFLCRHYAGSALSGARASLHRWKVHPEPRHHRVSDVTWLHVGLMCPRSCMQSTTCP